MIINIVSVCSSTNDPQWVRLCLESYQKRFPRYCHINYHMLKTGTSGNIDQIKKQESIKIKDLIDKHSADYFVFLDLHGEALSTLAFKSLFSRWLLIHKRIWIIIGGPYGFDNAILQYAHFRLKMSDMTLPHLFAKVFIVEQLYRVTSLLEGSSYHK